MRTIALLATLFALAAQAQVFKWVDEKGKVQYGETPPPGASATRINVPTASGEAAPAAPKAKAPEPKAPERPDRAERCKHERQQLAFLEGESEVVHTNEKGEQVPLDEATRNAAKQKVRDLVKQYCS